METGPVKQRRDEENIVIDTAPLRIRMHVDGTIAIESVLYPDIDALRERLVSLAHLQLQPTLHVFTEDLDN